MILKIQEQQSILKRIKETIFISQFALMRHAIRIPLQFNLILSFISFIPTLSVLFLVDPFSPDMLNKCFTIFDQNEIIQTFNISMAFINMLVMVIQLSLIISIVIKLRNPFYQGYFSRLLYLQMQFFIFFIVPLTAFSIQKIQNIVRQQNQQNQLMGIILFLNQIAILCIVFVFVKLQIQPTRKQNLKWRISNQKQSYQLLANVLRIVLFTLDQNRIASLLISLTAQIYLRYIPNQALNSMVKQISINQSNLIISTHLALLFQSFTTNKSFASELFLFLVTATILNGLVMYANSKKIDQSIPLCNSKSQDFYDFYYNIREHIQSNLKNQAKDQINSKQKETEKNYIKIHLINCKHQKCLLKQLKIDFTKQNIISELEIVCQNFIKQKSKNSIKDQLIFQLWKFQLGLKNNFLMKDKNNPLSQQFIISTLQITTKFAGTHDLAATNNTLILKTTFLDKMEHTTQLFSKFYEEISKPEPKLDCILSTGNQINKMISILKAIAASLIKNNGMTFKIAQLYMQFENYINMNCSQQNKNFQSIKKIQKNVQVLELEDLYLPAITFYPQDGNIQNVNAECVSFLNLSKFQIKSNKIFQIIFPPIADTKSLLTLLQKNTTKKIQTFLYKGNETTHEFGKVSIRQKIFQNKKLICLVIQKQTYSPFTNVFLVKRQNFQMVDVLKKQPLKSFNSKTLKSTQINWQLLFQKQILSKLTLLITQKVVKIVVQAHECELMLNYSNTINNQFFLVKVKYIKALNSKRNSSFNMNYKIKSDLNAKKNTFTFFYDIKQQLTQRVSLCGTKDQYYRINRGMSDTKSLKRMQKQLRGLVVFNTILTKATYSKNIMTYRLWSKDLYNVDLQDKQKYNQLFQEHIFENNSKQTTENTEIDYYLIIASILICSVGIFLGAYMLLCASNFQTTIQKQFLQLFQINKLRLYLFQIYGFTRDAQKGYYDMYERNWKQDVMWSYNKIDEIRNLNSLFGSRQRSILFNGIRFNGNTNSLLDIILKSIFYICDGAQPIQNIQKFQQAVVAQFSPIFQEETLLKIAKIQSQAEHLNQMRLETALVLGFATILYFLIMAWIINNRKSQIYQKLKSIMMISDSFAINNMENADKLKYAIQMIKKNFDFDLKSLLDFSQKKKNRKKSKQIHVGGEKKFLIASVLLFLICINIWFIVDLSEKSNTQMQKIQETLTQTQSIFQTYLQTMEISNYIDQIGTVNESQTINLMKTLAYVTFSRGSFDFSLELKQYTDLMLFQNSCQAFISKGILGNQTINCKNSTPRYSVQNPLQVGMIFYLRRIHYNLINNLTDTHATTGIFSQQFVKIYIGWAELAQIYAKQSFKQSFSVLTFSYWILIIGSLFYMILIISLNVWSKYYVRGASELINFFNLPLKNREQDLQNSERIEINKKLLQQSKNGINECSSINQRNSIKS